MASEAGSEAATPALAPSDSAPTAGTVGRLSCPEQLLLLMSLV